MRKLISNAEFCEAVGVFCIVRKHLQAIKDSEKHLAELLEAEDEGSGYFGHISDYLFDATTCQDRTPEGNAREMLDKMGVTVEKT